MAHDCLRGTTAPLKENPQEPRDAEPGPGRAAYSIGFVLTPPCLRSMRSSEMPLNPAPPVRTAVVKYSDQMPAAQDWARGRSRYPFRH